MGFNPAIRSASGAGTILLPVPSPVRTHTSGLPSSVTAMYERGMMSPDADTDPRSGMTGVRPLRSNCRIASMRSIHTVECPRAIVLHLMSMVARTHSVGIE